MGKHRIRITRDFIRFVTCLIMVCGAQMFNKNITLVLRTCKPAFLIFFPTDAKNFSRFPHSLWLDSHTLCVLCSLSLLKEYILFTFVVNSPSVISSTFVNLFSFYFQVLTTNRHTKWLRMFAFLTPS